MSFAPSLGDELANVIAGLLPGPAKATAASTATPRAAANDTTSAFRSI